MTNQINTEKSQVGSFVAGTLVHTKEGLKAIEQIKVGDYMHSKPESGTGELAYKRVTKTFVRENCEVFGLTYGVKGKPALLVTTAEHPFWVSQVSVKDPNKQFGSMKVPHGQWVTPEDMFKAQDKYYKSNGTGYLGTYYLDSYDGNEYGVGESAPICNATNKPKRNRVIDCSGSEFGAIWPVSRDYQRDAMGQGVDFRVNSPVILTLPTNTNITGDVDLNKKTRNTDKAAWIAGLTEYFTRGYQPKLCTVYNLEVEDYHTYFVGEQGIWVHNTCKNAAQNNNYVH